MFPLLKSDLFPAPPVQGAIPPTEEALLGIIENEGPTAASYFSLANLLLRQGRVEEAIKNYRSALDLEKSAAELYSNYGVALLHAGKLEIALSQFRQAALLKPELLNPHFHGARACTLLGDFVGAKVGYEKVLSIDANQLEALVELAEVHEKLKQHEQALLLFEKAHQIKPDYQDINLKLAYLEFMRGVELYANGQFYEAIQLWAKARKKFHPAFLSDQRIVKELGSYSKIFSRKFRIKRELRNFRLTLGDLKSRKEFLYDFFLRYIFSLGLIPEFFEAVDTLEQSENRWRLAAEAEGKPPFSHYRLALVFCYQGKLEEAEERLRYCQDKFPSKKQSSLKIAKLIAAVSELREVERGFAGLASPQVDEKHWEEKGFTNRFQRESWKAVGLNPEEAASWRDGGFSPSQARVWRSQKFSLEEAISWSAQGFSSAKQVKPWKRAEFSAELAAVWTRKFTGDIEKAAQWYKAGFSDPAIASAWARVVMFPWDAALWQELGFSVEDTERLYKQGIKDPYQALGRGQVK